MNILIVHNQYQLAGGEDTVAENEGALLKQQGHNVFFYIRNNQEINEAKWPGKLFLAFGTFFSLKSYQEIRNLIIKYQIQIVHVHNTIPLVSCSVYYAAKKYGCGLIQSIHNFRMVCPNGMMVRNDQICEDCLQKGLFCAVKYGCYRGSRLQSLVLAGTIALHRALGTYNKVDAYLVTTQFNREILSRIVPQEKIFEKAYCSDSVFRDITEKKREYYIYISRVERLKGIHVALEAFRKMPDKQLLIMGIGPDYQAALDYVHQNNLTNIEFLGFKSKAEMLELLFHAKALVFPTQWYEGYPMTIVESMAMGTPIIGSDIGNVGTIIQEEINGLHFHYDNPDSLKEVICRFDNNLVLAKQLETGAQQIFQEHHASDSIYRTTMKIYNDALLGE